MKQANGLRKYTGLMFRTRKTEPLIFDFDEPINLPIHSWFVFFPFTAIWYDGEEEIEQRIIQPWQSNIKPDKPFTRLVEIPIQ